MRHCTYPLAARFFWNLFSKTLAFSRILSLVAFSTASLPFKYFGIPASCKLARCSACSALLPRVLTHSLTHSLGHSHSLSLSFSRSHNSSRIRPPTHASTTSITHPLVRSFPNPLLCTLLLPLISFLHSFAHAPGGRELHSLPKDMLVGSSWGALWLGIRSFLCSTIESRRVVYGRLLVVDN